MSLFGSDNELNVTIRATDAASKTIDSVGLSLHKLAGGVALGTIAAGVFENSMRAVGGVLSGSLSEYDQLNKAVAQMNAVLNSTQHAAGMSGAELVKLSQALSENTLYQDDAVLSAQNLLLTFTNIGKETFPDATKAVLDMSTALGQDLQSSAIQLGKALNNPIEGVSALQRVGVSFDNSQQELIATMVKSGRTLDAQTYILKEIQREFGGSAESAYAAASSVEKLQKRAADLEQQIGSGLTPALNNLFSAFEKVTAGMGHSIDVGKVTFETFSKIGEFAANTAAGLHFLAAGVAAIPSAVNNVLDSVFGPVSRESDQFWKDYGDSVQDGLDTTVNFAQTLHEENEKVLDSWGDINDQAKVFKSNGPAAYHATAEEAKAAADAMKKVQDEIRSTSQSFSDFQTQLKGEDTDLAQAFVDQRDKIKDLKKQLEEELDKPAEDQDHGRVNLLRGQISKEQKALDKNKGLAATIPDEIAAAKKRGQLTDFERTIQDIGARAVQTRDDLTSYLAYTFNFNGPVAGDAGIQKIITDTIKQINRNTTLIGTAGK
jgi:hypothetical protein